MSDFFYGWRRKAGLLTLIMALAFAGAWSLSLNPRIHTPFPGQLVFNRTTWEIGGSFHRAEHKIDRLYSKDSCLIWETLQADAPIMVNNVIGVWLNTTDLNVPDLNHHKPAWKFRQGWAGFGYGQYHFNEGRYNLHVGRVLFPYWLIVIPLSLVSAYLIFRSPKRQRRQDVSSADKT